MEKDEVIDEDAKDIVFRQASGTKLAAEFSDDTTIRLSIPW